MSYDPALNEEGKLQENLQEEQIPPLNTRCTGLLKNKMQCIRKAAWRKPDDISGREALCNICLAFTPTETKDQYTVAYEPEV